LRQIPNPHKHNKLVGGQMVSPTIRLVEIEIDGALKGNPRALGAGGLIRDG